MHIEQCNVVVIIKCEIKSMKTLENMISLRKDHGRRVITCGFDCIVLKWWRENGGNSWSFHLFLYIFMLDFCSYIFRKMSTALKKTHCYSSLMKLCRAATQKYRPKFGNTTTSDLWTS